MKIATQIGLVALGLIASQTCLRAQQPSSSTPRSIEALWGYQAPTVYNILPRPATHSYKGGPNTFMAPPTKIQSRPVQPHAYGWFGTNPSPQWYRQFGNQNAYTQWTLK